MSGAGSPGMGGFGISVAVLEPEVWSENPFHSSSQLAVARGLVGDERKDEVVVVEEVSTNSCHSSPVFRTMRLVIIWRWRWEFERREPPLSLSLWEERLGDMRRGLGYNCGDAE
jgi:hypothetical protein